MRTVLQIPHPILRIVIYSWNEKYLVEMEVGSFKQTIKFDQNRISVDELKDLMDDEFIENTMDRFEGIKEDLVKRIKRT